jgi:hypothetical protein
MLANARQDKLVMVQHNMLVFVQGAVGLHIFTLPLPFLETNLLQDILSERSVGNTGKECIKSASLSAYVDTSDW